MDFKGGPWKGNLCISDKKNHRYFEQFAIFLNTIYLTFRMLSCT